MERNDNITDIPNVKNSETNNNEKGKISTNETIYT
jgi:hypothetical protein